MAAPVDERVSARADSFEVGGDVGTDDGSAEGPCLENDIGDALAVAWVDQDVSRDQARANAPYGETRTHGYHLRA